MTWSSNSTNFKARGCRPSSSPAGDVVEILVFGSAKLGVFPAKDALRGLLYRSNNPDFVPVPKSEASLPAPNIEGRVKEFSTRGRAWWMLVEFDLPRDAIGEYQLLVGWFDQPPHSPPPDSPPPPGEFTLVDTDAHDGLFRVVR